MAASPNPNCSPPNPKSSPAQVQVIGFDNNEEAPYLQIPLTTMDSRLDWTAPTALAAAGGGTMGTGF